MTEQPTPPWLTPAAADAYADRDLTLAHLLGYPFVLRALGVGNRAPALILDVGCGTGVLAHQVASATDIAVLAVDPSLHMLDVARTQRTHPRVRYRRFDGANLPDIADDSVPAAMCCLVYCTDPDTTRLAALTAEIHRVLSPGATFALLDLWPGAVGHRFSTLRFGDPDASYPEGGAVPTFLRRHNGEDMATTCFYRSLDTYLRLFTDAGFAPPGVRTPTIADVDPGADPRHWGAEFAVAPYMILTARKVA